MPDSPANQKTIGDIVAKYKELTAGAQAPLSGDVYTQVAAWLYEIPVESVSELMRHRIKSLCYFIAYTGD